MFENGFVLLKNNDFNYQKLVFDLKNDWQIDGIDPEYQESSFSFTVGGFFCSLCVMPAPIPGNEAELKAQSNYYCPNAITIAKQHQAHLMVTVMNQGHGSHIDLMSLYSKIICCCFAQDNATGVYTSGTVFDAEFYLNTCHQNFSTNQLPTLLWVFVGFGQNEQGNQLYTVGLEKFGKFEMEILNSQENIQSLLTMLTGICNYIVSSDVVFKNGETFGFSEEQKWAITESKSVYAPSETSLKLSVADIDFKEPVKNSVAEKVSNDTQNRKNPPKPKLKPVEEFHRTEEIETGSNIFKVLSVLILLALAVFGYLYYDDKKTKQKQIEKLKFEQQAEKVRLEKEAKKARQEQIKQLQKEQEEMQKKIASSRNKVNSQNQTQYRYTFSKDKNGKQTAKLYTGEETELLETKITAPALESFPINNTMITDQLKNRVFPPAYGFNAYFSNADDARKIIYEEQVNKVGINLSYHYKDIPSDNFVGNWVGSLEVSHDSDYQFFLDYSWANVKVVIDGHEIINAKQHAPDESKKVHLTQGKHLIVVEYISHWHTVDFTMNVKKVED